MKRPLLFGISYSPWTERARWALDHHGVAYDFREHTVGLGMPLLRWQTGQWRRDLTVPLLQDGRRLEMDSFDIAHYADEKGSGTPLIRGLSQPELAELAACVADSELAADHLRAAWVQSALTDAQAQIDTQPAWVPQALRPALKPVVRWAARYIEREFRTFEVASHAFEEREQQLRGILNRLRWRLHKTEFQTIFPGRFTYADIVSAGILQGVQPRAGTLVPSMQAVATHTQLAREFSDLIQWRDRIYARYRLGALVPVDGVVQK